MHIHYLFLTRKDFQSKKFEHKSKQFTFIICVTEEKIASRHTA